MTIDNEGNLTYGPGTNNTFGTYTYDPRNELTSAGGISYGYDPAGNRTSLTNGTNVAVYVIDPRSSQLLMRIKAGITNYYVYGTGLLYESDETATTVKTAFYHYDVRVSTVTLTDGNGNPTDMIEYSPYGTITYRTNAPGITPSDTPFLYNGQFGVQTDPNGLLYMRARYYNPYISRFINADPSGFGGGLNFYAFCGGNPINETDPFGLCAAGDNDIASWLTSGVIGKAGALEQAGLVRYNYNADVAQLEATGAYSSARTALQVFYNQPENSTPLAQGISQMYRWEQASDGIGSSLANPTTTAAAVNNAAAWAVWGGRGVMAVGVAADAYQVATAPNTSLALAQVGGATVGSIGGASAGVTVGAFVGSFFGPGPGTAVGALIGGFIFGAGGGAGGHYLGTAAYQSVNGFSP